MAQILASVRIDAPAEVVFGLIKDQAQRERFLPDGWRVLRLLTERHDSIGAMMEVETKVGPAPTLQVLQTQAVEVDSEGEPAVRRLVESPPTADNYITTWTVLGERESEVYLHTEFSYGDMIGEFFARRRLRKAQVEMLARLKAVAEVEAGREGPSA